MDGFSPLENDVWLKGTLVIRASDRRDHRPLRGKRVLVEACGFH